MEFVKALYELQSYYEKSEKVKKVVLDGSYLYLLRKMKKEFEETKKQYNAKVANIESIKNEYATISKELKDVNIKIEHDENELYNNSGSDIKAINILQGNIKNSKNRLKVLEDKAITLLETEEKLKFEIEAEKSDLINLKNNFYSYKENTAKKIEEAKKALAEVSLDIENSRKSIPKEYLDKFDKIKKQKKIAVSKVSGGVCSGCKMKVSSITLDELYKNEKTVFCDNCGRILVDEQSVNLNLKEAK